MRRSECQSAGRTTVSFPRARARASRTKGGGGCPYRVQGEDAHDFLPFCAGIHLPCKLLGQSLGQVLHAVAQLRCRVLFARQAAGKGGGRHVVAFAAPFSFKQELGDGDGVGRVKGQLRHPGRRVEDHLCWWRRGRTKKRRWSRRERAVMVMAPVFDRYDSQPLGQPDK